MKMLQVEVLWDLLLAYFVPDELLTLLACIAFMEYYLVDS